MRNIERLLSKDGPSGVFCGVMDKYSKCGEGVRGCARCGDSHLRGRLLMFKCEDHVVTSILTPQRRACLGDVHKPWEDPYKSSDAALSLYPRSRTTAPRASPSDPAPRLTHPRQQIRLMLFLPRNIPERSSSAKRIFVTLTRAVPDTSRYSVPVIDPTPGSRPLNPGQSLSHVRSRCNGGGAVDQHQGRVTTTILMVMKSYGSDTGFVIERQYTWG
ncbi:hypothetical protein PIB30_012022 [Stylosanthes scabra]|uniref:Uncharacterized protein n=1 Tax=Stylosanthes scabra TaxID=79078 RepID=A0ABU6Z6C6_9FABA|nr:hypothetical protein [Stylosanthes scabra]